MFKMSYKRPKSDFLTPTNKLYIKLIYKTTMNSTELAKIYQYK